MKPKTGTKGAESSAQTPQTQPVAQVAPVAVAQTETPLAGTAVLEQPVAPLLSSELLQADRFLQSQADQRKQIVDNLFAAKERATVELEGINQRLAAMGETVGEVATTVALARTKRKYTKRQDADTAPVAASGERKFNKSAAVLHIVQTKFNHQKNRYGLTMAEINEFAAKHKPPMTPQDVAMAIQSKVKNGSIIYTKNPKGTNGRGGFYRPAN